MFLENLLRKTAIVGTRQSDPGPKSGKYAEKSHIDFIHCVDGYQLQ